MDTVNTPPLYVVQWLSVALHEQLSISEVADTQQLLGASKNRQLSLI